MTDQFRRHNGRRQICHDTTAHIPLWFPAADLYVGECKAGDVVETASGLRFVVIKASLDDVQVRAASFDAGTVTAFTTAEGRDVEFKTSRRPTYIAPLTPVRRVRKGEKQ